MVLVFELLLVIGLIRYLVATDQNEAIWGVVAVVAVAVITGSGRAVAFTAVLAVATLLGLRRLNRV